MHFFSENKTQELPTKITTERKKNNLPTKLDLKGTKKKKKYAETVHARDTRTARLRRD